VRSRWRGIAGKEVWKCCKDGLKAAWKGMMEKDGKGWWKGPLERPGRGVEKIVEKIGRGWNKV
jgi:hypothetical protein